MQDSDDEFDGEPEEPSDAEPHLPDADPPPSQKELNRQSFFDQK